MAGLAPRLPLTIDQIDGAYGLLKDIRSLAQQNLKMLILTEKGERIMIPQYGVGLKRKLFENKSPSLESSIQSAITSQVNRYLPYISIQNIEVGQSQDSLTNISTEQSYELKITYIIIPTNETDMLTIAL
jgi:phage baseplate assembly protein W